MCTRAVGALAHYLEQEGVPTTQISLVRLHTECIKPPRALWVPFELGRPLGIPADAAFQKRVLLGALRLLEEPSGPVLEDFPEEALVSPDEVTALACPVSFPREDSELSETEKLYRAFQTEMAGLRPWYDMVVDKRGRSTVGVSGIELDSIDDFLFAFLRGETPELPRDDISTGMALKMAADDLKAYYSEAVTAQPGQEYASSRLLDEWFWNETVAGRVLLAIREALSESEERSLAMAGRGLIVPRRMDGRISQ